MESSNNENCATKFVNDLFFWNYKFVNDLEIIEEKAAAGGDEVGEGGEIEVEGGGGVEKQYWKYVPLYKAALTGDWKKAKRIINGDGDALTAKITQDGEIALHVAVATEFGCLIGFSPILGQVHDA
ncbi:uncharacterized protein LOC114275080 [Camellia sinensis]|uniref:uncharacterized protein LOC114275080 n=1 Tax=Camellia sinensis TaxID=4442 RepID=UPI0010368C7B|nr:uncharacterized protein LOC114275080 [Camellia sinensis]